MLLVALALPYLTWWRWRRRAGRWWRGLRGLSRGEQPGADLWRLYRRGRRWASRLTDHHLLGRVLLVEVAPGVQRVLVDVSGRGQTTAALTFLRRHHHPLKPQQQVVVDIGAHDGFVGSHSFNFLQLGWRCAMVEPNPEVADQILEVVEHRRMQGMERQLVVRTVAVSADGRRRGALAVSGWRGEDARLLAPDDPVDRGAIAVDVEDVHHLIGGLREQFRSRGLEDRIPKDFGVLSLDCGGDEVAIMEGFLQAGGRPLVVIADTRRTDPDTLGALLTPQGYRRIGQFDGDVLFGRPRRVRRAPAPSGTGKGRPGTPPKTAAPASFAGPPASSPEDVGGPAV